LYFNTTLKKKIGNILFLNVRHPLKPNYGVDTTFSKKDSFSAKTVCHKGRKCQQRTPTEGEGTVRLTSSLR
jgi:hypothetical protein